MARKSLQELKKLQKARRAKKKQIREESTTDRVFGTLNIVGGVSLNPKKGLSSTSTTLSPSKSTGLVQLLTEEYPVHDQFPSNENDYSVVEEAPVDDEEESFANRVLIPDSEIDSDDDYIGSQEEKSPVGGILRGNRKDMKSRSYKSLAGIFHVTPLGRSSSTRKFKTLFNENSINGVIQSPKRRRIQGNDYIESPQGNETMENSDSNVVAQPSHASQKNGTMPVLEEISTPDTVGIDQNSVNINRAALQAQSPLFKNPADFFSPLSEKTRVGKYDLSNNDNNECHKLEGNEWKKSNDGPPDIILQANEVLSQKYPFDWTLKRWLRFRSRYSFQWLIDEVKPSEYNMVEETRRFAKYSASMLTHSHSHGNNCNLYENNEFHYNNQNNHIKKLNKWWCGGLKKGESKLNVNNMNTLHRSSGLVLGVSTSHIPNYELLLGSQATNNMQKPSLSEIIENLVTHFFYYTFPSSNIHVSLLPQYHATRHRDYNSLNSNERALLQDWNKKLSDWRESFSSLFYSFYHNLCPYFVLILPDWVAMFCCGGLQGQSFPTVTINRSTKQLRDELQKHGVEYSTPIWKNYEVDKEATIKENEKEEELNELKEKIPGQVVNTNKESRKDNIDVTLLLITSDESILNLYNYIMFFTSQKEYSQRFILPQLYARTTFINATLKQLHLSTKKIKRMNNDTDVVEIFYTLDVEGVIFPEVVVMMLKALEKTQSAQNEYYCSGMVERDGDAMPFPNDNFSGNTNQFVSRSHITTSSPFSSSSPTQVLTRPLSPSEGNDEKSNEKHAFSKEMENTIKENEVTLTPQHSPLESSINPTSSSHSFVENILLTMENIPSCFGFNYPLSDVISNANTNSEGYGDGDENDIGDILVTKNDCDICDDDDDGDSVEIADDEDDRLGNETITNVAHIFDDNDDEGNLYSYLFTSPKLEGAAVKRLREFVKVNEKGVTERWYLYTKQK